MIPYTKQSLYDALSFLAFFDWGYVSNNSPRTGETKDESLYSVGWGLRFNLSDRVSVAFDLGIPLAGSTSDGSDVTPYIETKVFL